MAGLVIIRDEYGEAYNVPGPFATFADIRELHRARGGHYFDTDTSRFFRARYVDDVIAGRIFIDSVQSPYGAREYRASVLTLTGAGVARVADHNGVPIQGVPTLRQVRRIIRDTLDANGYAERYPLAWHDANPPCVARAFTIGESLAACGWDVSTRDTGGHYDYRGTATLRASCDAIDSVRTHGVVTVTEGNQTICVTRGNYTASATIPYVAGVHDFVDTAQRLRGDCIIAEGRAQRVANGAA